MFRLKTTIAGFLMYARQLIFGVRAKKKDAGQGKPTLNYYGVKIRIAEILLLVFFVCFTSCLLPVNYSG
jgi:hypothetical protein